MSDTASSEWQHFLDEVQMTRVHLKCSASSAWYRGHSNSLWPLQPTILREYILGEVDSSATPAPHISDEEFKKIFNLIDSPVAFRLRTSSDQAKSIHRLLEKARIHKEHISKHAKRSGELKYLLTLVAKSHQGVEIDSHINLDKLYELARRYRIPVVLQESSKRAVRDIVRDLDDRKIRGFFDEEVEKQKRHGAQLDSLKIELRSEICVAYGERDAFTEFNFRWKTQVGSSWRILALMQHHGTPTRLLDWSESLFIALWFALKKYIAEVERIRRQSPNLSSTDIVASVIENTQSDQQPSLWVMNPYNLAQEAIGRNRIVDFTLGNGLDYYQAFFQDGWPYKIPAPMYSPWRESDRLSSQYAMFTVHGTDLRPLDHQVGPRTIREITLSRFAAAFGAYQLNSIFPTDKFSLFRDMDSLGKVIGDRHIHRN